MQLGQSLHASSLYLARVILARPTVPPITQPVQSPHTSSLYLTRVLLTRTTYAPIPQLVQSPNALGLYLTRVLLEGMNCAAADAVACAISILQGFTQLKISWHHELYH